ncbi:MAG: Na+/H+ antiporter subunit E [bacterium]
MQIFGSNVLLAVVWTFLTGDVSMSQFLFGFSLGYVVLFFFRGLIPDSGYFRRTIGLAKFIFVFIYKNIQANFIVAWEVITPTNHMAPGFLKIDPESNTPLEITWLAATISLIPGTLTVDTSEDDDYLYIHAMHISDPEEIKREILEDIEPSILEFLR